MASKRHLRRRSCAQRHAYATQQAARDGAKIMTKTYKKLLMAYKCNFCDKWHIGHPPAKVRRSMIERRGF